jgi:SAM-dependent methyltransferase
MQMRRRTWHGWVLLGAFTLLIVSLVLTVWDVPPPPSPPVAGTAPLAQPPTDGAYHPESGQPGKDVVWVPSANSLVDTMLNLAGVTARDVVVDLGSGDGRTVIAAAQRGARALGIEFNPDLVALSKRRAAQAAGVGDRAAFVEGDIFAVDFSHATVVTMFLLPELNLRLRPTLLGLAPGTRIVSNTFTMDDWMPDATAHASADCENWCTAFLWVVPANAAGRWSMGEASLTLTQQFQTVTGTLASRSRTRQVVNGRLRGTTIEFAVDDVVYTGTVTGDTAEGECGPSGRGTPWRASRARTR